MFDRLRLHLIAFAIRRKIRKFFDRFNIDYPLPDEETLMSFAQIFLMVQTWLALVSKEFNAVAAEKDAVAAYETVPPGSTTKQTLAVVFSAILADATNVFPDASTRGVAVWLLGFLVAAFGPPPVTPTAMMAAPQPTFEVLLAKMPEV